MYYPDYLQDLAAAITYDRINTAEQHRAAASTGSTSPVQLARPSRTRGHRRTVALLLVVAGLAATAAWIVTSGTAQDSSRPRFRDPFSVVTTGQPAEPAQVEVGRS
jgi:hypothetical protein